MALSDSAILLKFQEARDTLVTAFAAGEGYVEIEIRGRRWKAPDPEKLIDRIERQIRYYEDRINSRRVGAEELGRVGARVGATQYLGRQGAESLDLLRPNHEASSDPR